MTTHPRHPGANVAMTDSASSELVLITCLEMFCPLGELADSTGCTDARNCRAGIAAVQAKPAYTEPLEVLTETYSRKTEYSSPRPTSDVARTRDPDGLEENGENELEAMRREVGVLSAKLKDTERLLSERENTILLVQAELASLSAKQLDPRACPVAGSSCASEDCNGARQALEERLSDLLRQTEHLAEQLAQTTADAHQFETAKDDDAGDGKWKTLFDKFDEDDSGSVDMDELERGLHESALILSESDTFQKKRVDGGSLNVDEFSAVMNELRGASLVRFFDALDIPQHFAKIAKARLSKTLDPLATIAGKSEHKRLEFAQLLIKDVSGSLAKHMAGQLVSEEEYKEKHETSEDDKFHNMQLGPRSIYDEGLENLLGPPDSDVLEAMQREHLHATDSEEVFEAYNGRMRRTKPTDEWHKVLPNGLEGDINNLTYDGEEKLCEDMMTTKEAKQANLQKYELVALRLYSGPMFKKYNEVLRRAIVLLGNHMENARITKEGELTADEEEKAMQEAMASVRSELGRSFINTIHAINSGLIKLARITVLPASGCGYRGISGLKVPSCFLIPDQFGCRAGVEGGFLSTSSDKLQAMGYIEHDKGMPQLLVMRFGSINRGADISWLSYFPGEKEILLPPLSCLEVVGTSRYEHTDKGLVRVTPIGINVNLKGRTIEELQAIRKNLHTQMADNAMSEVSALVREAVPGPLEAAKGSPNWHALRKAIHDQCRGVVQSYRERKNQDFNNDNTYSSAIQNVLKLKPWAMGLINLNSSEFSIPADKLAKLQIKECLLDWDQTNTATASIGLAAWQPEAAAAQMISRQPEQGYLQPKEELEDRDSEGRTALARCAATGKTEAAKLLLLGGARIDTKNNMGWTPLMCACEKGHTAAASLLVDKGADVNAKGTDDKKTPLMVACEKGLETTASLLVDKGADVDAKDSNRWTPLIWACDKGLEATASLLVDKGATVNVMNLNGKTPLLVACEKGLETTACLLVDKGADVNAKCTNGWTPLRWDAPAVRKPQGWTPLRWAFEKGLDVTARLLVDKGADVNDKNDDGWTPLIWACEKGLEATASLLVDKGANVNTEGLNGKTPLMVACEKGLEATASLLVDKGADVNAKNTDGKTSLWWAFEKGLETTASLLIEKGADVNAINHGWTLLIWACENGLEATASLLVDKGANVNTEGLNGKTPLMVACEKGLEATASLLVDKGADVNAKNTDGKTSLWWAFEKGLETTASLLVEKGADVNAINHGKTLLMWACENGLEATASLLVDKGADVNAKNYEGRTPLWWACEKGLKATVRLLIDKGADVKTLDREGWTPLMWACEKGYDSTASLLVEKITNVDADSLGMGWTPLMMACARGFEVTARLLVDKGADVNAKNYRGWTPLMMACENGHDSTASLLVEKVDNVNDKILNVMTNEAGKTPLMVACEKGLEVTARLLVDKGADVNETDKDGGTPLMWACENGLETTASLLVDKDADVNAKNTNGWTALMVACAKGLEPTASLLIDKGADVNAMNLNGMTPLKFATKKEKKELVALLQTKGAA